MGVEVLPSTLPGGVSPVCNRCGCALCWDVSEEEYAEQKAFWDAWVCRDCNGGRAMSLQTWLKQRRGPGAGGV